MKQQKKLTLLLYMNNLTYKTEIDYYTSVFINNHSKNDYCTPYITNTHTILQNMWFSSNIITLVVSIDMCTYVYVFTVTCKIKKRKKKENSRSLVKLLVCCLIHTDEYDDDDTLFQLSSYVRTYTHTSWNEEPRVFQCYTETVTLLTI